MRKLLRVLLVLLALLASADRLVVSSHSLPQLEAGASDRSMGVPETPAPPVLVAGSAVLSHTTAAQDDSTHATWPVYWSAPVIADASQAPRSAPAPAPRRLFPLLI